MLKLYFLIFFLALNNDFLVFGEELASRDSKIILNPEEYPSLNYKDGVLVPSILVSNILSRLKSHNEFNSVAVAYMDGYSKELAQIITSNKVSDYRANRVSWFRFGAEDAIAYTKKLTDSGESLDGNLLYKFGYEKVKILATYNILKQVEYGVSGGSRIQTYASKKIEDELEEKLIKNKREVNVELSGWISPIGLYDSESNEVHRILIIEKYHED